MPKKTSKPKEAITEPQTPPEAPESLLGQALDLAHRTLDPQEMEAACGEAIDAMDQCQPQTSSEPTVYDFSHGKRCPRCKTTDTVARSTQGRVQYRRCLRAVCRKTYSVVGRPV